MTTEYVFGGDSEKERLAILARVTAPSTRNLLVRAGVASEMRCLDVGCGTGAITRQIATLVGPAGVVIGVDRDPNAIELARSVTDGYPMIEFRVGLLAELPKQPEYDVVYARFLLTHLPDPLAAVFHLRELLKPGGVLVVEDIDFDGHFAYPASPAFHRFLELYKEAVRQLGGDPCIGPKLLGIFQDAKLQQIAQEVILPTFYCGEGKTLARRALLGIREKVLALGMTCQAELESLVTELEAFETNPRSMNSTPRIHQLIGYRSHCPRGS